MNSWEKQWKLEMATLSKFKERKWFAINQCLSNQLCKTNKIYTEKNSKCRPHIERDETDNKLIGGWSKLAQKEYKKATDYY